MSDARDLARLETDVEHLKDGLTRIEHQLEAQFDRLDRTLNGRFEDIKDRLKGHSERLGRLERWRSWIAGGLAALGLVWTGFLWWLRGGK